MKKLALSVVFGALAFSANSFAAGDVAAGKGKAALCAACHGMDGVAITPLYPNLKGQNAPYLENALKAYRAGERKGGMSAQMAPMAAGLSDQDISDLAAYFESLK